MPPLSALAMTHTEEVRQVFYEDLSTIVRRVLYQHKYSVLGDFSAHVVADSDVEQGVRPSQHWKVKL